ncbi:MAG: tetratricopeptide repeat protein [Chitinophagaceae bacterium]
MIHNTKIVSFFLAGLLLAGCTHKKDDSPYSTILAQPPFAAITDSIRREPGNDELYFRRAVLLNSNNLPEPALSDFQKAWSLKKDERYAYGLGNLLLDKKPDSAILFLGHALKELPQSFLLKLTLAHAYQAGDETDKALKLCDELLQENPGQVDVLKMKADLLEKKGDKKEMIAALQKAYNLTPFDVELNYMLALKLAETGNERVLSLCDSLIHADSSGVHAEPYYYKGIYYSTIKDRVKAIAFFDKAIKIDYNFLDGYIEKAGVLYDMKKYGEALEVLNLCLTISPKFADAYYWAGKCQEALGQTDEARLNYQRAYGLDNGLTEAKEAAGKLK